MPSSDAFHSVASRGSISVVPGLALTSPSNIWRETRKVSPSLAMAGSSITGSDEAAKTKSPPLLPSVVEPVSRWLWAQDASVPARVSAAMAAIPRRRILVCRTMVTSCCVRARDLW